MGKKGKVSKVSSTFLNEEDEEPTKYVNRKDRLNRKRKSAKFWVEDGNIRQWTDKVTINMNLTSVLFRISFLRQYMTHPPWWSSKLWKLLWYCKLFVIYEEEDLEESEPEPEPLATPEPEPAATPEPEPAAIPEPEPAATPEPEPADDALYPPTGYYPTI